MSSRRRPRRALPPARRALPPARRPQSGRLAAACQVLAARRALANSLAADVAAEKKKIMGGHRLAGVDLITGPLIRPQTSAVSGVVPRRGV